MYSNYIYEGKKVMFDDTIILEIVSCLVEILNVIDR